jgi:hypothetical protein
MQAVGLVEVAVLVGEGEGHGPEIARGGVLLEAGEGCASVPSRRYANKVSVAFQGSSPPWQSR